MNLLRYRPISWICLVAFINLTMLPYQQALAIGNPEEQEFTAPTKSHSRFASLVSVVSTGADYVSEFVTYIGAPERQGIREGYSYYKAKYQDYSWGEILSELKQESVTRIQEYPEDLARPFAGPIAPKLYRKYYDWIEAKINGDSSQTFSFTLHPDQIREREEQVTKLKEAIQKPMTGEKVTEKIKNIFSVDSSMASNLLRKFIALGLLVPTQSLIANNINTNLQFTANTTFCFDPTNAISVTDIAANATLTIELLPHLPGTGIVTPTDTTPGVSYPNLFTWKIMGNASYVNATIQDVCFDFGQNPSFNEPWTLEVHVDNINGNIPFTPTVNTVPSSSSQGAQTSPSPSQQQTISNSLPESSVNVQPSPSPANTPNPPPSPSDVDASDTAGGVNAELVTEIIFGTIGAAIAVVTPILVVWGKNKHSRDQQRYEFATRVRDEGNFNYHNFHSGDGKRFAEAMVALELKLAESHDANNYSKLQGALKNGLVVHVVEVLHRDKGEIAYCLGEKRNILYGKRNVLSLTHIEQTDTLTGHIRTLRNK